MRNRNLNIELALSYTPPGSELSMTLAIVRDSELLVAALRIAIAEAEASACDAGSPLSASGYETKAAFLRGCLAQILGDNGLDRDLPTPVM